MRSGTLCEWLSVTGRWRHLDDETNFTTADAAKFAAQHVIRIKSSSCVSRMRRRYGLSLAASDLWKLAKRATRSMASNVNCSVSGEVTVCDKWVKTYQLR